MALTPLSGSSSTTSKRSDIPTDIPTSQSGLVTSMPYVSDSNLNKFAIDPSQYPTTTKQLLGFIKGKRTLVTYYRLLHREGINNRTNIADNANSRNILHSEYQKIKNLEITLPKEFDYTANTDQGNMSIKGQAVLYPNMNPNIGDIFTLGLGDGRVGVCRVSSITPMSWRTDRVYMIDFAVTEFVNDSNHASLEAAVKITSVFAKQNYLGGTAALLSEETYLQLAQLKATRSNLCKFYHRAFFDTSLGSYIRPDQIYDPYVVQFMTNKISMDDVPIIAKNLLGINPKLYHQTIWSRLEDRYNTSLHQIAPRCIVMAYKQTRMAVFTTELYKHDILYPSADPELGDFYLYSINFYNGVTANMTAEELLIYTAITQRTSGVMSVLITSYLDLVLTLDLDVQFYKIPLYIHLIDMALQNQYREIDAPSMSYATPSDEG